MTHFPNSVLDLKSLLVFHHPPLVSSSSSNLSWRLQEVLENKRCYWENLTRNVFSAFASASMVSMSR